MATPPPEVPPVTKEDKPQLPPSPTGPSAPEYAPTSAQNVAVTSKTDGPADTEVKSPALNGHTPTATSNTNGTIVATSPPKSPDHQTPSEMIQNKTPSAAGSAPPAEPQPIEEKTGPLQGQESTTPAVANAAAESVVSSAPQAAVHAPTFPASTDGPHDTPEPMAIDTPQGGVTAVKTDLPHHPTPGPAPPALTALQPVDQEMKDASEAPLSPSKISRQRDADLSEEPAPKRTKVEGDDSVINFQTPGFNSPTAAPPRTSGGPGLTKMQHKFISKSLTSLKRMHDARFYKEPVDPVKLNIPQYRDIVTHPMDLGTMERKLKNNQYSSPQAVADDFALMVNNTTIFNGADHLVTQEGIKLKATFEKQMTNLPKPEEVEERKPKKNTEKTSAARREPRTSLPSQPKAASPQSQTFALGPEGLPVIRRDSSNPDGRPKRSIHPPKRDLPYSTKPKKKKFQWELRFCQEVLDELHKQKHYSWVMPFYYPVDPVALNIPTYHSVIKKPMDLSTAQSKLKTGQYENAKEFENDVRLVFKNCYRFNIPGDPTYICGQRAEEIFNAKWAQKSDYLEAHEPHPEQNTDSSDEDSDEDAEESEEDDEKLTLLQKQIAEMSRQVEAITNKKKKTPPSSKKVGKTKLAKKDSKKISSGKRDKKSKISQPGKTRAITYNEKQIISNGISSLPDKRMQQALQIIQNNVPQLKGTDEAEIELDIDELPNDVLLKLLNFVKKHVPNLMDDDDEDDVPTGNVAPPKPKKNKPMSKFEQEAQINMLQNNLSRFQGGAHSPDPVASVEHNESSDDESDSSEEESEEE
ncbi:Bromodomain [Penicillium expansum]|uniref:Bromodomain n=1 Tax=Penicillium expansum TaxID=27334 RepID=A0A0A2KPZ7_PENEN|nr:Bromodomain [Penicillium expansum]KGO52553.1 Bromodomain [Penicillium expansum]KGO69912.1 Bromodomain [Penicillium expansum]